MANQQWLNFWKDNTNTHECLRGQFDLYFHLFYDFYSYIWYCLGLNNVGVWSMKIQKKKDSIKMNISLQYQVIMKKLKHKVFPYWLKYVSGLIIIKILLKSYSF